MDISLGNAFNANMRIVIFVYVTMAALLGTGGADIYETKDSRAVDSSDFKRIWDSYILPRLEMQLKMRNQNQRRLPDVETVDYYNEKNTDSQQHPGVAGLENMDIMTTLLDQAKVRSHALPLSVGGMNTNRLRKLMLVAGRRRK